MLNEFELIQQQKIMQRFYSRTTAAAMAEAASSKRPVGERMRVAIVGGGAAAMTSALHLAPLVDAGLIAAPIDVYPGDSPIEREIGVGVWSTALTPFLANADDDDDATRKRLSHRMVWDEMMHAGLWVGQVGYRTPQGSWLARSELPTFNHIHGRFENQDDMPGLLFLREADMLGTLRRAVQMEEEQQETIQVHPETRVEDIDTKYTGSWSSPLQLTKASSSSPTTLTSERDYHLIVAADGSHSILRRLYGGHRSAQQQPRLTGTNVFRQGQKQQKEAEVAEQEHRWKQMRQAEANAVEDRRYSVLRGNAPMTREETGVDGISFQTWGVGSSMRFATVPMLYPDDDSVIERQVWFATTSDPLVTDESDPLLRKERLMESFSSWHDPITTMMETTDAQDILMERAVAHRHCVDPVINTSGVLQELHGVTPPSRGPGPAMVFVGDSFMTVDPILAQGFTCAMEGAYDLCWTVQESCRPYRQDDEEEGELAFNPYLLRKELQRRHNRRQRRLVALLRATDVVQALGQPSGGVEGFVSQRLVRPAMRITPDPIKRPIFNAMLKYSLGL